MARQYQEDADEILHTTLVKDILIAGVVGLAVGLVVFLLFSRECLHIATPEEVAGRAYEKCLEYGGLNWGHLQWYLGLGQLFVSTSLFYFLRRRRHQKIEDERPAVALYS